jgi:hypothetical protein
MPSVDVLTRSGESLGIASATSVGEPALLQTLRISEAGLYTISVNGAGTLGSFELRTVLNAAVETEHHGHLVSTS